MLPPLHFLDLWEWKWRLPLVTCSTCMCDKAMRTHMHTHAGMCVCVLQWREESRGDKARHPVPSPISVMSSTSPSLQKWVCAGWGCAISHPLHWLTWSGGICEKAGIPAVWSCMGAQNVAFNWRIQADQRAVKRFSFAKEIFVWKSDRKLDIRRR